MKINYNKTYTYDDLHSLTKSFCSQRPLIEFSIFKTNEGLTDSLEAKQKDIWYVDAPDVESDIPVFDGLVQFFTDYWRVTENGPIFTPVLENPTWRQIINAFNDLLQQGDGQGVYLEGFRTSKASGTGFINIEFVIGS